MSEYIFEIDTTVGFNEKTGEIVLAPKYVGEIVRCKDCKHARNYIDSQHHSWLYCENCRATDGGYNEGYYHIEEDFFCADGERRESE